MLHTFNDTSSPAVAQIMKSLRYRMEDCNYVFSHQPESMKFDEWEKRLLSDAVESGNTIAKLIVLDREPSSKQNYMERSRLLDNAIRTCNPIA